MKKYRVEYHWSTIINSESNDLEEVFEKGANQFNADWGYIGNEGELDFIIDRLHVTEIIVDIEE